VPTAPLPPHFDLVKGPDETRAKTDNECEEAKGCVAVDTMLARISFSGAPPTLGLVDFVGLTARVKLNEVWHRIDGKNCFLLL
jgi:hypothetical protein